MRRRAFRGPPEPKLMIIPMIDIIFFLLVFFMMSTLAMTAEQTVPLALPRASQAVLGSQEGATVSVTEDGAFHVDGRRIPKEELPAHLMQERERRPEMRVILRADAMARHEDVLAAMDAIRAAGIDRIGIAAESGAAP